MDAQRAAFLDEQQRANFSSSVTYSRAGQSVSLLAGAGRTEFVMEGSDGAAVSWTSTDFLLTAADLILDGQVVEPRSGDRISRVRGSITETFEVLEPAGQKCFRTDGQGVTLRVHAKKV